MISADDISDQPFSPTVKSAGGLFFVARLFAAGTFGFPQLWVFLPHYTYVTLTSDARLNVYFFTVFFHS